MKYSQIYGLSNSPLVKSIIAIAITFSASFSLSSIAQTEVIATSLVVKPNQCVALRQGQDCYVDIELSWQASADEYCLFSSQQKSPIKCWQKKRSGRIKMEMVANKNVNFYLKKQGQATILAETKVEMAWVYKKNSRSHLSWRMF